MQLGIFVCAFLSLIAVFSKAITLFFLLLFTTVACQSDLVLIHSDLFCMSANNSSLSHVP